MPNLSKKGSEHFESAQLLQSHQRYRDAVSRAYYAIYTEVANWLGGGKWNHRSIRRAFAQKMHEKGIPNQHARHLNNRFFRALEARVAADYSLDEVTTEIVEEIFEIAQTIFTFLEDEVIL